MHNRILMMHWNSHCHSEGYKEELIWSKSPEQLTTNINSTVLHLAKRQVTVGEKKRIDGLVLALNGRLIKSTTALCQVFE